MAEPTLESLVQEGGPLWPQRSPAHVGAIVHELQGHPEEPPGNAIAREMLRGIYGDLTGQLLSAVAKRRMLAAADQLGPFLQGYTLFAQALLLAYMARDNLAGAKQRVAARIRDSQGSDRERWEALRDLLNVGAEALRQDPSGEALARALLDTEAERVPLPAYRAGLRLAFATYWLYRRWVAEEGYE